MWKGRFNTPLISEITQSAMSIIFQHLHLHCMLFGFIGNSKIFFCAQLFRIIKNYKRNNTKITHLISSINAPLHYVFCTDLNMYGHDVIFKAHFTFF